MKTNLIELGVPYFFPGVYMKAGDFFGLIRTLISMATYSFLRLIMGKVEFENVRCNFGNLFCNIYLNAKVSQPLYIRFFFSMVHLKIF